MKTTLIILFLFILSVDIFSQPNRINIFASDFFHTNVIVQPSVHKDSVDVFLFFTLFYDGLVFQKINDDKYFSVPNMEVTFKDYSGITKKRLIYDDTIFTDSYEQTQENFYYSNSIQFRLANDDYKVVSQINNSKRRANPIEYTISKFSVESQLNNIFILDNMHKPFYSNGSVPFNTYSFSIFIPFKATNPEFHYTIKKIENKKNELNWKTFDNIEGKFDVIDDVRFDMKDNELILTNNNDMYSLLTTKINMFLYHFTPGKYILTITNDNNKTQFDFEIKWYNIPISLLDPTYAVEQMYLILTDAEYKQIKTGNKNETFTNILDYWKHHDPTPMTEYNEAMAEFFSRVDYAELNFRTLIQKEGAKSDRGKIYILNGKPDIITTSIKDKKTNEVWHYSQLDKKYIFEVVSVGVYKLVKIEE